MVVVLVQIFFVPTTLQQLVRCLHVQLEFDFFLSKCEY